GPVSIQCPARLFECRTFPTAAVKSQSQKLPLLPPIPQTLFLLQSRSAPKSVSVSVVSRLRLEEECWSWRMYMSPRLIHRKKQGTLNFDVPRAYRKAPVSLPSPALASGQRTKASGDRECDAPLAAG